MAVYRVMLHMDCSPDFEQFVSSETIANVWQVLLNKGYGVTSVECIWAPPVEEACLYAQWEKTRKQECYSYKFCGPSFRSECR